MRYIIYGLIDPRNGELRYVGQSSSGLARPRMHAFPSVLKRNTNPHKCNWVRSLLNEGMSYEIEVLEVVGSQRELDDAEVWNIAYFRSLGCRLLNATTGGCGNRGYRFSAETKKRISESLKGRTVSESTRAKLRERCLGKPSPKRGVPVSEDQKRKQARSMGAKPFVDQFGNRYESLYEAADKLGIPKSNICHVLKGNRKSAGGYEFRYIGDDNLYE